MNVLRWFARVVSVLIILFFVASLLGDRRAGTLRLLDYINLGLWFAIMIGMLLAWKWEVAGGIIILGAFLVQVILNPAILGMWAMLISPAAGLVFLLCGLYGKKKIEPVHAAV